MKTLLFSCTFFALLWGASVSANDIVIQGKNEILNLDSLSNPERWGPDECTVGKNPDKTPSGRSAMLMEIPVDHFAGEKKYPIGWPRMYTNLNRPAETAWENWDRLVFEIKAEMSRKTMPKSALTFQVLCPDRHQNNHKNLEMKLGEWVTISLETSALKHLDELARLGFNISESNYNHGDKLRFHIGGFRLLRSAECKLGKMELKTPVLYGNQGLLKVNLVVQGPPKNMSRGIPFEVRQKGKVLRHETLPARRGSQVVEMEMEELRLPPGDYELVAFPKDKDKSKSCSFKVVESPWKKD